MRLSVATPAAPHANVMRAFYGVSWRGALPWPRMCADSQQPLRSCDAKFVLVQRFRGVDRSRFEAPAP
jgi:hypothetical protein